MKKLLFTTVLLFIVHLFNAQVKIGINPTTIAPSAILEIESTTQGILIPKMNSTQRDAITSPSNALLIFNTSNNNFEVYKSTCSCWVSIYDGGNNPASNLVNTAPTASSLNYTGIFRDGGTATIVYTYADAQDDAEGATTLQWEIANDAIGTSTSNLSTGASVTFGPTHVGRYVRIKLIPRAATGILNGITYYGGWNFVSSGTIPYGSALNITGTVAQGSLLTGVYTFNGGSGVENSMGSVYNWQSASNNDGVGIQNLSIPVTTPPQTTPAHTATFTPLSTEIGRYIRFGVKATDNASLAATDFVYSDWVGPVTLATEAAPVANNVTFSPASPGTNVLLTASYTYADANDDPEGTTLIQWYTADNATGTNQTPIAGANASTFTVTNAQVAKFIGVGVTPVAATGTPTGTQVVYYDPTASVGTATFTITGATQTSNSFYTNRSMDDTDRISVTINVTSPGTIAFSSNTVNGYSFSTSGTFATGTQNVVLTATGTQTTFNAGGDAFTITAVGTTTETTTLTVANVKVGADFTAHYNGITAGVSANHLLATYTTGETFSNNSTCLSKPISASACVGSTIVVGSNTYAIADINGQCWMTQNLNELPNGIAVTTMQWTTNQVEDLGYYGYYNTAFTNGSGGWAASMTGTDGLLYQWSAAMVGSTTERAQGVCPTGWHIPSDCEWMYLEHGIGMSITNQGVSNGYRATTTNDGAPGNKVKTTLGYANTNFNMVLNGTRQSINGGYIARGSTAYLWTSTSLNTTSSFTRRTKGDAGIARNVLANKEAFGIRCLKD